MPVIAGIFRPDGPERLEAIGQDMVAGQGARGALFLGRSEFGAWCGAAKGTSGDTQRGVFSDGPIMLAVDAHLHNRDEVRELAGSPALPLGDAALLYLAYRQVGRRILDVVAGDFAFAAWNSDDHSLTLARDPTGQRPLHYVVDGPLAAFASLPSGLQGVGLGKAAVDYQALAEFVADVPRLGTHSFFAGIKRVLPGEIVTIQSGRVTRETYFSLPRRSIRYQTSADYEEALREHLDRAVTCRTADAGPRIGAHLSGGLDSGAVTATAALVCQGNQQVFAFTAAPRSGFSGAVPAGRLGDESDQAAMVAAQFNNVVHQIIRDRPANPLDLLERDCRLYEEPIGHPCNQVWWIAILDRARALGVEVMLTGEAGNLGLSAGTVNALSEFIRRGWILRWMREAALVSRSGVNWRGALGASFGPWLPSQLISVLAARQGNEGYDPGGAGLLAAGFKSRLDARVLSQRRGGRSTDDDRQARWNCLVPADPGCFRKRIYMRWGIEERDATSDRRLLGFCFALPPDQLIRNGITRSLVRRAMGDRLPAGIRFGPRGYQSADWYEGLSRHVLTNTVTRIGTSRIIDMTRLSAVAASWPEGGFERPEVIVRNRLACLRALSAALFESGERHYNVACRD